MIDDPREVKIIVWEKRARYNNLKFLKNER